MPLLGGCCSAGGGWLLPTGIVNESVFCAVQICLDATKIKTPRFCFAPQGFLAFPDRRGPCPIQTKLAARPRREHRGNIANNAAPARAPGERGWSCADWWLGLDGRQAVGGWP